MKIGWIRQYGIIVAVGILLIVVIVVMYSIKYTDSNQEAASITAMPVASDTEAAITAVPEQQEMLAIWVPYFSLDRSGQQDKSEAAFRHQFEQIISDAKAHKMNTLVVQVRPFADAFYPSALFPWSGYLTGTQGVDPGYDPLAIMVEAAHNAGLQIHAWVNPMRVKANGVPHTMAESNPYLLWKSDPEKQDWCLPWAETDGIYMNVGIPEVRQYIADGVGEIVRNYDVDGIQFDDYFYPTADGSFDAATYQSYCDDAEEGSEVLSQQEWRKANVSSMLSLVYSTVKEIDSTVVFGVSPQGNLENNEAIGADPAAWCSTTGYVDYICPQLYYNFENPYLPYDEAAAQWKALVTNHDIKLYFGLGLYKASSDADEGTWKNDDDILARQVNFGRTIGCDGFMIYSYEHLNRETAQEEVENVMAVL